MTQIKKYLFEETELDYDIRTGVFIEKQKYYCAFDCEFLKKVFKICLVEEAIKKLNNLSYIKQLIK